MRVNLTKGSGLFSTTSHGLENRRSKRVPTPLSGMRRGVVMIELLVALPVLLAILLGTIEFSMILVARQQLQLASREGARVASIGGNETEVQTAVQNFLGKGALAGAQVQSILTDAGGQPIPSGGSVQVVVTIPTTQAVPNLLGGFGVSVAGDTLIAGTAMRKE